MTVRLEDMLRPGERVVWRVPRRRQRQVWRSELAVALFWIGAIAWAGIYRLEWSVPVTLATAFVLFVLRALALWSADERRDAAVTNQRAFTMDITGNMLAFGSVELSDVRTVEVRCRKVRVSKAGGTTVELEHPTRAADLGRALAESVGLPEPCLRGCRVETAGNALEIALSMGLVFTVILPSIAGFELSAYPWPLWLPYMTLYVTAAISLWWFGGGLIGILLLRPFLTREELRQIVLRTKYLMSHPEAPEDNGPLPRLYLRFVNWLYGGPDNGAAAEGENHDG